MNSTARKISADKNIMGNQFFGEIHDNDYDKKCLFSGLLKNTIMDLDEEYSIASKEYTDCSLNGKFNDETYDAEFKCRIIKAKRSAICDLQKSWEDMLSSVKSA